MVWQQFSYRYIKIRFISDLGAMTRIVFHIDVNSAFLSWSAKQVLEKGYKIDIRNIVSVVWVSMFFAIETPLLFSIKKGIPFNHEILDK